MDINGRIEAENIILQAIGHSERRGIIRIIGVNPEGVTYSSILGETELNTGHLNYHLRNLEGLIEKRDDRLYRLTPLGLKSLEMLNSLRKEIDSDMIQYVEVAKGSKDGSIHLFVKVLLYIGIAVAGMAFLFSIGLFVMNITNESGLPCIFASLAMAGFTGIMLWGLVKALKTAPKFMRRLERKLMND